jgi:hypothetical protein
MKRAEKLRVKREEGAVRTANWASLSTKEKIADLDRRLGVGQGAVKQRARLAAALVEESKPKAKKEAPSEKPKTEGKKAKKD